MKKQQINQMTNQQIHEAQAHVNIKSSEISDALLLAYWQGETDATTTAFIEADDTLMIRAQSLLRTAQERRQPLPPPRAVDNTPSAEEIGAYHLGVLAPEQAQEIARFLKSNPSYAMELQLLDAFLDTLEDELPPAVEPQEPARASLLERAKTFGKEILVATLATAAGSTLTPAYTVRGDDDGPQIYLANDLHIGLEIEDDLGAPGYKMIVGTILNQIDDETMMWRAELWADGHNPKRWDTIVDELGGFEIEAIKPGHYHLVLTDGEQEIHIQTLEITT